MFYWSIDDEIDLRILEPRHAPELFGLADRNRQHLSAWLPWIRTTHEVADTELFIRGALEQYAANKGFHAGIWYRAELAGAIGLHVIDWANRNVSLGYWLSADKQGSGIVTKAARAVTEHCFQELELHRVEIRCGVKNYKSQAVPLRLGFHEEGVLRQAQWLGDRWMDIVVYSKLASDPVEAQ
jgi:ribosomal-protein-serine acetyltransferase